MLKTGAIALLSTSLLAYGYSSYKTPVAITEDQHFSEIQAIMSKHPKVANQFGDFVASHNKNYKDVAELKQKLLTFKENMEHIDNHDESNSGFKVGVNMFSDMTEEEFVE